MFRISSGDVLDLFWRCFRFLPEFAELGNGQIMPANERAEILAGHWLPFIIRLRTGLKFSERSPTFEFARTFHTLIYFFLLLALKEECGMLWCGLCGIYRVSGMWVGMTKNKCGECGMTTG